MRSLSPLVGRAPEMESLGRLLKKARAGRGSVALIEGEPGIGKTRLLGETLAEAGALGFVVIQGSAEEMEQDRPFGLIVEALSLRLDAEDPRRIKPGAAEAFIEGQGQRPGRRGGERHENP